MIYSLFTIANAINSLNVGVNSYNKCVIDQEQAENKTCGDLIKYDKLKGGYWFFQEFINCAIESTNEANCDHLIQTQQKNCVSEAVYDSAVNFIGMELAGFAAIGVAQGIGYTASCIGSGIYHTVNYIHDHIA